jgi:hypothetical protein
VAAFSDLRLRQKQTRNKYSAKNSENCCKHDIGQIVRGNVHAREADEQRDGQTSETDPPIRKAQNTEKSNGRRNVTGGKRVKF